MLYGVVHTPNQSSLLSEYSLTLGDALLRNRARVAERAARIEAELASRVKSEFISTMSHELRTPLNTIIGFSKLLSETDGHRLADGEVREFAQLINDAAGQLLSVINDILDISKIRSGRYTIDDREVALDEVLLTTISGFAPLIEEAGLTLEHTLAPDLPPARGDASKLAQVFANLLSNSLKFSRAGGTISILASKAPDGGSVTLVRDEGVGMTEEEVRVALTPFGQVDGGHSRWREGAGLGLPIAEALVGLHGGRLEIRSEKNKGTEVAVLLPSPHHVTINQGREAHYGYSPGH